MKFHHMPIKFLKASGKGFFVDKDGYALAIRDDLADVIGPDAFKAQMKDIIEYRTMEYYRRRYVEKQKECITMDNARLREPENFFATVKNKPNM